MAADAATDPMAPTKRIAALRLRCAMPARQREFERAASPCDEALADPGNVCSLWSSASRPRVERVGLQDRRRVAGWSAAHRRDDLLQRRRGRRRRPRQRRRHSVSRPMRARAEVSAASARRTRLKAGLPDPTAAAEQSPAAVQLFASEANCPGSASVVQRWFVDAVRSCASETSPCSRSATTWRTDRSIVRAAPRASRCRAPSGMPPGRA